MIPLNGTNNVPVNFSTRTNAKSCAFIDRLQLFIAPDRGRFVMISDQNARISALWNHLNRNQLHSTLIHSSIAIVEQSKSE